jgi:DNA-directed RNA polymerase subunit RPC12/RpoP
LQGDFLLKSLEQKAQDIVESGGSLAYLSRQIGVFILFKETEDGPMHVAYKCPECGHEEKSEMELKRPYTVNCSKCNHLIFKQEKVKGKRKPRKKKEA